MKPGVKLRRTGGMFGLWDSEQWRGEIGDIELKARYILARQKQEP